MFNQTTSDRSKPDLSPSHSPTKPYASAGSNRNSPAQKMLSQASRQRQAASGNRTDSPMSLPVDQMQYGGMTDGSPYQSPAHSRSNSMTSSKGSGPSSHGQSSERLDSSGDSSRNYGYRSLDRGMGMGVDRYQDNYGSMDRRRLRDRSLDREYLSLGRNTERDYNYDYGNPFPRDSFILELQAQMAEVNKDCAIVSEELQMTKEKLSSSMNSIKTFWSPELKKERALRKEESAKHALLNQQLKQAQSDMQKQTMTIQSLQEQINLQHGARANSRHFTAQDVETMKREKDRQAKELIILRKTVEEMNIRIDTQKQTLSARDESIKKLLEMLKSKGLAVHKMEDDRMESDKLRTQLVGEQRRGQQLETDLAQKHELIDSLQENLDQSNAELSQTRAQLDKAHRDSQSLDSLQALMEGRDNKIESLEQEVQQLEEQLEQAREISAASNKNSVDSKEVEALQGQERLLKSKVENLKIEVSNKDTELAGMKTQLSTLGAQFSDQQQHILVLKEQITAKERKVTHLHADIDDLRERLVEKEEMLDKKSQNCSALTRDKARMESELREHADNMEAKDRQITVFQRKVDNLEEQIREKEDHINTNKTRIASLQSNQTSSDSAVTSLEESITEKEKQIEKLKEQKERLEKDHQEEVEMMTKTNRELKKRLEDLQKDLEVKTAEMSDLREEIEELSLAKSKKASTVSDMESALEQKVSELDSAKKELQMLKDQQASDTKQNAAETDEKVKQLEAEVAHHSDQVNKSQNEIDRLLDILKEVENEKYTKDKQIKELQETLKEIKQKVGTLKRTQQGEKKKSAQMLEEARKREGSLAEDKSHLKTQLKQKEDRVEELQEALKESVKITAEREVVVAEQQHALEISERQVKKVADELDKLRKKYDEKQLYQQLEDKEAELQKLRVERKKQLDEVMEMKQEALLASISEKDSHIGLLEMSSPKTPKTKEDIMRISKEKDRLHLQLKELTQKRMKIMMQEEIHSKDKSNQPRRSHDQVIQAVRQVEYDKRRLSMLIDQLVAACLDNNPQILEGLPRIQISNPMSSVEMKLMRHSQLSEELSQRQGESNQLQGYINTLIQKVSHSQPTMLRSFLKALDGENDQFLWI